jgi:8-oxo-dGTP diphosphatase
MPHIHTEPGQIDQTATAYVALVVPGEEPKMLLHMHRKLGVLLPFGGHVELHESVWQAVAHELQEESGYTLDELQVMQPPLRIKAAEGSVLHPQPVLLNTHTFKKLAGHYHGDAVFFLTAQAAPSARPAQGESDDIRALTARQISDLTIDQMYPDTQSTALALLSMFLDGWEPVPATDFGLELPNH